MIGVERSTHRRHNAVPSRRRRGNSAEPQCPEAGPQHEREHDIGKRNEDIGLEGAIGVRLDVVGDGGQLLGRDLRGHGRGQHQQHELAGQRRIDLLDGRQQDDVPVDLEARQGEAFGRLDLAARDGFEAGAHDLGGIGADIDRERGSRDGEGGELEAEAGEAEIDEEDLDQQRRIADRLDIEPCRRAAIRRFPLLRPTAQKRADAPRQTGSRERRAAAS